jgi:hypothetical protein
MGKSVIANNSTSRAKSFRGWFALNSPATIAVIAVAAISSVGLALFGTLALTGNLPSISEFSQQENFTPKPEEKTLAPKTKSSGSESPSQTPQPSPVKKPILVVPPPGAVSVSSTQTHAGYTWEAPKGQANIEYFEVGFSILKQAGLSADTYANYVEPEVYSVSQVNSTSFSWTELYAFITSKASDPNGQSVMMRVRAVYNGVRSEWGGGAYTVYDPTFAN